MRTLGRILILVVAIACIGPLVKQCSDNTQPKMLPGYVGGTDAPSDPWSYNEYPDEMSAKTIHQARIASSNAFEFKFPYQGSQHAILVLRTHPRFGKDAILQISKGQFLCRPSQCSVTVRFGDGKPQQWPARESSDHDSTTLFLGQYDSFVSSLSQSKVVRIEPTLYQEGDVAMTFPVAGFNPAKYAGK
jgi:hypothetical protein